MRAGESSLLVALRRENESVQDSFASFRAAVEAEVERAGSRRALFVDKFSIPEFSVRVEEIFSD